MVFNTGAALLDAIVLSVVSNLQKEHMGIRSRRMSVRQSKYRSLRFIRCCGGFRRMTAWKHMTGRSTAETDGITK